ncbi:MAG: hypothetical protein B0W54_13640 [Cellvibrio sp. 79]|nr:MAG: hypothetical protein B0W54_13640 [Cellvibrio sp. 79]
MSVALLTGYEKKLTSWASVGLLVFIFAFLWAPSRDGLQIIYLLSFFLPVLALFFFYPPKISEYLNYPTAIALCYGAFSVCSTFWGDVQSFGFFLLQWMVLATWLCGASIVSSRAARIDVEKFIFWFLIIGCIAIIAAILYHYVISNRSNDIIRLVGWNVFRNPNEIGAMCGVVALLAIINAFQSLSIKRAFFYYFLALIALAGVVLSFSRAAMLAVFITSLLAFIIIRPSLRIWLAPGLVLLFAMLWFFGMNGIPEHYLNGRGSAFSDRFTIWNDVIKKSLDHLFIGKGMSEKTDITLSNMTTFNHAHNAWIDTYYRTGIIGLFLVMLHLIAVVVVAFSNKKTMPFFLWFCFGCICSFFDGRTFFWEIGAKWFLYWLPAGLIVAYAKFKD